MPTPSVLQTVAGTVAANLVGLAVAFGAPISQAQQDAILAVVASVSVAVLGVVGYLHGQHAKKTTAPFTVTTSTSPTGTASVSGITSTAGNVVVTASPVSPPPADPPPPPAAA